MKKTERRRRNKPINQSTINSINLTKAQHSSAPRLLKNLKIDILKKNIKLMKIIMVSFMFVVRRCAFK